MKKFSRILGLIMIAALFGCSSQPSAISDTQKETVKKEVTEQFNQLAAAIGQKNVQAWSNHYSNKEFISAIVVTDYFATREAWVETITKFFASRDRQALKPDHVRVTPLTSDLALLTSEGKAEMKMEKGKNISYKHVMTMLWKKEADGWKILHSTEAFMEIPAK